MVHGGLGTRCVHVGPMLVHVGLLGPGDLWAISGPCRGHVGPIWDLCWTHVGRMLGHLGAIWGSMEVSGVKKLPPTETFSVEVNFGGYVGPRLDHLGPISGPCW